MHRVWEIPFLSEYGAESYRLRASHAFSKYTQFYTIIENLPGAKLIVTEHENSLATKDTTSIFLSYEIDISEKDWNKIQSEIQRLCFWSNEINNDNPEVLDGGTWLIEGYDPDRRNCANSEYHVNSCSYGADNAIGKVCNIIKKYAQEERLHLYIDK